MAEEKAAPKASTAAKAKAAAAKAQYKGEAPSMTNEEIEEKLIANEGTSSDATHSSYAEADVPETYPPAGRVVEQTPGEPSMAEAKRFGE